jgi:hypothetical protein
MNFESDIEWFPDAGGITGISPWRKPLNRGAFLRMRSANMAALTKS